MIEIEQLNFHRCCHCKRLQLLECFQLRKNRPNGWCRECRSRCEADRRITKGFKLRTQLLLVGEKKLCGECNHFKFFEEFSPGVRGSSGIVSYCRPCQNNKYPVSKDKAIAVTREYRKRHHERWKAMHRLHQYKRRTAIELTKDATITDEFLKSLYAQTTCTYCDSYVPPLKRTLDHVVALHNGGKHSASNCVMACRACNNSKTDQDVYTFLEKLWQSKQK